MEMDVTRLKPYYFPCGSVTNDSDKGTPAGADTLHKEAREVSRCGIKGTVCDNERQIYSCA
jgi:hypothetical protein